MFKNPFSFKGRIRRLEYALSYLFLAFIPLGLTLIDFVDASDDTGMGLTIVLVVAWYWFSLAQGAKRSHDIGNSGFWQLVPFYKLILFFAPGHQGSNEYGRDPKEFHEEDDERRLLDDDLIE